MRPIDADALKEKVLQWLPSDPCGTENEFPVETDICVSMVQEIDNAPTIDAVPVVHGYNTKDDSPSLFGCSVCGWFCWDTYCGDTDTFNYCPNCGAKMDGKEKTNVDR